MKHGKVSVLSLLLCAMAPLVQAQTHSKLFVPNASLDQTPVARMTGNDPSVMREKAVSINFKALLNAADQTNKATASVPEQLDIELFDGQILTLSKTRVDQRSPKDYTWYGEVKGATMGQAILTVVNGYLSGNMSIVGSKTSQNGSYKIQSNAQGQHFLRQIDQSKFPQEHPDGTVPHVAPPSPDKNSGTKKNLADGGVTKIDVMVLYSNNTANAAGAAIDSEIQQAIDSTNASYQNSGIPTRIRLARAERANYTESGNFETDLASLSSVGVDTLRNAYGADLVTMLIENPQYCGLAAAIGAQANTAFAVINRGCASSNLSFAHELGHLYGARHDTLVDPSSTPKQYAHGYTNTAGKWRTVMAYNNACANAGVNCTRIPYFSTPLLNNNGAPLGTASVNDNVRVHNEAAATIASFRASKAPEDTGIFNASINNYSITQTSTGFTVTDNVGKDGTVNFSNIFRLKFSDASVALDINANAGQIYRLYRAAFNRIPDLGGIGYWLKSMDGGGTLEGTAGAFIASAEFISLYGANPSDATFINLLYANVLHRSPDQGGYDYWLARLAAGMTRPAVLVSFSESAENKNQVAAALSHGIVYIPYQTAFAANNGALLSPFSKSGK